MSRTLILGVTWPGKIKAMAKKTHPSYHSLVMSKYEAYQ